MRFAARVLNRFVSILLLVVILVSLSYSSAFAQTQTTTNAIPFAQPNLDANVPQNQHTFIQSIFLEMLLAIQCQLTGIDFTNPTKSCLGINMADHKLGYAPENQRNGQLPIGGVLGMLNSSISMMFTPTFSSKEYFNYLSDNFGISKKALAAPYTGFQGLSPILSLWKTSRDIAYFLLIVATIFIGIGVMLRLHIDPRTVMTIQNQIPNVIICIFLITFSYAFAGLMIDGMWAVTYMGINRVTQNINPNLTGGPQGELAPVATQKLLSDPFDFANDIFVEKNSPAAGGVLSLAYGVGQNLGDLETNAIMQFLFGVNWDRTDCSLLNIGDCPKAMLMAPVAWVLGILMFLIAFIALIVSLFRIWLELLRAYIMILLYVILAPVWIVFGLLPKRPLGFERWLRVLFAHIAVFPVVVLLLVTARVFHEAFNNPVAYAPSAAPSLIPAAHAQTFIPPLIANPNQGAFSLIISFGMVLMAPGMLTALREKLSAQGNKTLSSAVSSGFAAGRGAAGAPARGIKERLTKRDQAGNAVGFLAGVSDSATAKMSQIGAKILPGKAGKYIENQQKKKEYARQHFGSIYGWDKPEAERPTTGPHGQPLGGAPTAPASSAGGGAGHEGGQPGTQPSVVNMPGAHISAPGATIEGTPGSAPASGAGTPPPTLPFRPIATPESGNPPDDDKTA